MEIEIKPNDVFHAYWKDVSKSNHCFEGLLVATVEGNEREPERIILVDRYWGSGGNKWFTLAEAEKQLNLTFYCNLNDYDLTNVKNAPKYYDETDYIFMHDQHACSESCKYYYLKKGAVKSTDKMLQTLESKIEEYERKINSCKSGIEWAEKDIQKIKKGEIEDIYL